MERSDVSSWNFIGNNDFSESARARSILFLSKGAESSNLSVTASSSSIETEATEDSETYRSFKSKLNVDLQSPSTSFNRNPLVVGHRGCLYLELENTREGFQRCAEMGTDAVELDVFLLKCGTLVVFHGGGTDECPGELLDYCGVEGSILDYTYAEALGLSFNPDYAEFGCPSEKTLKGKIPTLEQVLSDAKESGLFVKIELKGEGTVVPTLELVEKLQMTNQCSYASFDHARIAELRALRPDRKAFPTGALFDQLPVDYLQRALNAGASEVHMKYDTVSPEIVSEIHRAGLGSMVWFRGPIGMASDCRDKYWDVGNEDFSMYEAVLRTGVQQMCINRPDVLLAFRKELMGQSSN